MTPPLPAERDRNAWRIAVWNLPDDLLSQAQKLQFMLMLEGGFNQFDPFRVIGDLLANRELWQGAVVDRAHMLVKERPDDPCRLWSDLIKLRDVGHTWNVDTLFIHTKTGTEDRWTALVDEWTPDITYWVEGTEACQLLGSWRGKNSDKILAAWWD
jgi:hypothetical protein